MKFAILTILSTMAFINTAQAKNYTVNETQNSACAVSVQNAIYELEKTILQSNSFSIEITGQKLNGTNHTIELISRRQDSEMGKKIYLVEVNVREIGKYKELICEINSINSEILK